MDRRFLMLAVVVVLGACGGPAETNATNIASNESGAPAQTVENDAAPLTPPAPGTPGGLPNDRTPLAEPKGAIDPKSAEAAGQVMQHYAALLEQRHFAEASKLWGESTNAAALVAELRPYSEFHLQVGKPGDTEGAAGSIYVSVPVSLYGRLRSGGQFNRSGSATLRRVNDVDGSTEAQRRWHIERIEWGSAG
jgi:hypothetical protein